MVAEVRAHVQLRNPHAEMPPLAMLDAPLALLA